MNMSTQHQSLMIRRIPCGSCNAYGYMQCADAQGYKRYYPHATRIKNSRRQ